MRIETLIDLAGGVTRLARALGVAHPTVLDWKNSGYLPGSRLTQVAETFHIPLEQVATLLRPPPSLPKTRPRRAA